MINVDKIKSQLSKVTYPGFTKDIVTFGFVKDIEDNNGIISIIVDISSSAQEVANQLREDILKELSLIGISNPNIIIKQPQAPKEQSNSKSGKNIAPNIKNFIMVSSGKGGVGKSTTTVNLAVALAMQGKKVGVLDADIYGPNIPRMLGINGIEPQIENNKVIPINAYGMEVMSMGLLMDDGQSLIWRGSMIMKAIEQFLRDISWGDLDVLVIDMPPGTGDAQLTLAQSVPVTAGINVTTPQNVALDDSRRSLDMFKKLNIPIAGVIENMSGFVCPSCETESDIFGKGTCSELVKEFETVVLGDIPIEPAIREGGDGGKPIVYFYPDSVTAKRYQKIAHKTWESIEKINENGGASNESIQPTTPSGVSACSTQAQSSSSCSTGSCGCN